MAREAEEKDGAELIHRAAGSVAPGVSLGALG